MNINMPQTEFWRGKTDREAKLFWKSSTNIKYANNMIFSNEIPLNSFIVMYNEMLFSFQRCSPNLTQTFATFGGASFTLANGATWPWISSNSWYLIVKQNTVNIQRISKLRDEKEKIKPCWLHFVVVESTKKIPLGFFTFFCINITATVQTTQIWETRYR